MWTKLKVGNMFGNAVSNEAKKTKSLADALAEKKKKKAVGVAFKVEGLDVVNQPEMDGVEPPLAVVDVVADRAKELEEIEGERAPLFHSLTLHAFCSLAFPLGAGFAKPEKKPPVFKSILKNVSLAASMPKKGNVLKMFKKKSSPPNKEAETQKEKEKQRGLEKNSLFGKLALLGKRNKNAGGMTEEEKAELTLLEEINSGDLGSPLTSPTTTEKRSLTGGNRDMSAKERAKDKKDKRKADKKTAKIAKFKSDAVDKLSNEKHWEVVRLKPVDTARLYLTLAIKVPSYFEKKYVTESVLDEETGKKKNVQVSIIIHSALTYRFCFFPNPPPPPFLRLRSWTSPPANSSKTNSSRNLPKWPKPIRKTSCWTSAQIETRL